MLHLCKLISIANSSNARKSFYAEWSSQNTSTHNLIILTFYCTWTNIYLHRHNWQIFYTQNHIHLNEPHTFTFSVIFWLTSADKIITKEMNSINPIFAPGSSDLCMFKKKTFQVKLAVHFPNGVFINLILDGLSARETVPLPWPQHHTHCNWQRHVNSHWTTVLFLLCWIIILDNCIYCVELYRSSLTFCKQLHPI